MVASDTERKGHKRKLADTLTPPPAAQPVGDKETLPAQVQRLIAVITKSQELQPQEVDKANLRRATHTLAELSKSEENVDVVVAEGGITSVVPLLNFFPAPEAEAKDRSGEDVEKEACFILGLLAIKSEHQHKIADLGALPGLVNILKRHLTNVGSPMPGASVVRRAADAITNLAHENVSIKSRVRAEGGIPPLVALLQAYDAKVQRAAAGALRTLAFKNEDNKNLIVSEGALPVLIQMLKAEDAGIHYEAVGVIGNLVHSSPHIKKKGTLILEQKYLVGTECTKCVAWNAVYSSLLTEDKVLEEGALQPVIGLLSCKCHESQRESALLLGQFATTDGDYKAKIVQRGAVPPLINMLSHKDAQLKEMAAFALGRLAQAVDNQAGIVQAGGLPPLLELLESKQGNLQHNAAFALYGLADNKDNIPEIVRQNGVSRLHEAELIVQASKDCVQKTIKRLEEKIEGHVLKQILYSMHSAQATDKQLQQRVAMALARLAKPTDLRECFVNRKGLEILLELLTDTRKEASVQKEAAGALCALADRIKLDTSNVIDCQPEAPKPQVYLGEKFVNNQTLSDVTFLVENKEFFAHRIALLASSDIFRAMFDGHYKEKEASTIPVPNIKWPVFTSMMRAIYTGSTDVTSENAEALLQAADQYMLDGLKRLCEQAISKQLSVENLTYTFELSENFSAHLLGRLCAIYALENYEEVIKTSDTLAFAQMMQRMMPRVKDFLTDQLSKAEQISKADPPEEIDMVDA